MRSALGAVLLAGGPLPAFAWGPHAEITRAAIDTLPADCAIHTLLGPHLRDLERYCWIPDWRGGIQADFFPDDYILFPAAPHFYDHILPGVRTTYPIFFRRALWALRHETTDNAARWVGSLLHFTEDSGSPPHAAEIGGGTLHTRMENWLDARQIVIGGYIPRSLGSESDEEALKGYLARMDRLIAYSKERAEKLRAPLEAMQTREDQPLILECALEVTRVVADLLLTLGERARDKDIPDSSGGTLRGRIAAPKADYLPGVAPRIALLGTDWSTGAGDGRYEFHNLPPGRYQVSVLYPGCPATVSPAVDLGAGETKTQDIALPARSPAGNRLRNPDFTLRWVRPDAPDGWQKAKLAIPPSSSPQPLWRSENLLVKPGERYRIGAEFPAGLQAALMARWNGEAAANKDVSFTPLGLSTANGSIVTVPPTANFLQVLILTDAFPETVCKRVWCVAAS